MSHGRIQGVRTRTSATDAEVGCECGGASESAIDGVGCECGGGASESAIVGVGCECGGASAGRASATGGTTADALLNAPDTGGVKGAGSSALIPFLYSGL